MITHTPSVACAGASPLRAISGPSLLARGCRSHPSARPPLRTLVSGDRSGCIIEDDVADGQASPLGFVTSPNSFPFALPPGLPRMTAVGTQSIHSASESELFVPAQSICTVCALTCLLVGCDTGQGSTGMGSEVGLPPDRHTRLSECFGPISPSNCHQNILPHMCNAKVHAPKVPQGYSTSRRFMLLCCSPDHNPSSRRCSSRCRGKAR